MNNEFKVGLEEESASAHHGLSRNGDVGVPRILLMPS
jgi:hypothetical protein